MVDLYTSDFLMSPITWVAQSDVRVCEREESMYMSKMLGVVGSERVKKVCVTYVGRSSKSPCAR